MILKSLIVASALSVNMQVEQIKKNSPLISSDTALNIAKAAKSSEKRYGVPSQVLLALAFVESSYKVDAVNRRSNDFGLMQINTYNIKAYSFDAMRLQNDIQYSMDAGAKVFKWFYKRYPLDEAIKRYNCGTRKSCINWKSVRHYLRKVKRSF